MTSRDDSHAERDWPEPHGDPDPTEWLGAQPPPREQSWQGYDEAPTAFTAPPAPPQDDAPRGEPARRGSLFRRGSRRNEGHEGHEGRHTAPEQPDRGEGYGDEPTEVTDADPGLFTRLLGISEAAETSGPPGPVPAPSDPVGPEPPTAVFPGSQQPGEAGPGGPQADPQPDAQPDPRPDAQPDARPDPLPVPPTRPKPEPQPWPVTRPEAGHTPVEPARGSRRGRHAEPPRSSRDEILARVRAAVGGRPEPDEDVPRRYRRSLGMGQAEAVALFAERVADYRATVRRIPADQLPAVIAVCLVERAIRRIVVPADLPRQWLPHYVDVWTDDGTLTPADLDGVDGVITGSALGIAETGTIVLDGGRWQGRRALSLVPDYHLCVVDAAAVVGNLPEALARIDPTRPVTFVSGPSATSDIELERVEGVHGPRTLDVLLVDEPLIP